MAHVLFVCLHNAGRSQMSSVLFDAIAAGRHTSRSAGSRADPEGHAHPEVVVVLDELDFDLRQRRPQPLTREIAESADVVVTMGCGDECPHIPGKRHVEWDLPDPKGRSIDEVRATPGRHPRARPSARRGARSCRGLTGGKLAARACAVAAGARAAAAFTV